MRSLAFSRFRFHHHVATRRGFGNGWILYDDLVLCKRHFSTSTTSSSINEISSSQIARVVLEASDLLPTQGILENFVHHNPLEHLQGMEFTQAIDYAHRQESYMSPGERAFTLLNVDPRKRVNEAVADLCSSFLDRGAAKWTPRYRDKGFLYFFASLECLGFAPWRGHARDIARRILREKLEQMSAEQSQKLSESILKENLEYFGIPQAEWTNAVRAMMLELRGWAGMFRRMETHPDEAPNSVLVRLLDFCAVQSILTRSSLERSARWKGKSVTLAAWLKDVPSFREPSHEPSKHSSAISFVDQSAERRETLESTFEDALLFALSKPVEKSANIVRPTLQVYTCIDDRECSFRRHLESMDSHHIETFGVAGFFGIPFRYAPVDGRNQMTLAPEGNNPSAVLVECETLTDRSKARTWKRRRRFFARMAVAWENAAFSPIGSIALSAMVPISLTRLWLMGFAPTWKQRLRERFFLPFLSKPRTDFAIPFTPDHAAMLLARTFKDIGTHHCFAPLVIVLGHGAVSVNNPFAAAYNCGACGGREGGPNARLLARLANDIAVRAYLAKHHDVRIPDDTVFIGGMHNTTADTVELFDLELVPETHRDALSSSQRLIATTLGKNALERCDRFLLAEHVHTPVEALRHVHKRSTDAAEVRPELNHASNAGVIIGRRDLTKGRFFDRRVFLPSYDPFSDDDAGTNLEHVLAPALVVCSGINLEYLFSTTHVDHHGAGTKAPLNMVGNLGVVQGVTGDLRTGLPSQMTEMHTPVRALYVVDAPVARIEAVLERRPPLRDIVRNGWIRLIVRDPNSGKFYRHSLGGKYEPISAADGHGTLAHVPFAPHRSFALEVAHRESVIYKLSSFGMVAGLVGPLVLYGANAMNPYGCIIAVCGTLLSLPVLAFARRYLHGEYMFGRFAFLSTTLLFGFNLVATAPTLEHLLAGWGLFGFASTFLIGAYNDRASVRNNATFAFAAYRISDFALITAAAFSDDFGLVTSASTAHAPTVAAALLVAAFWKSSQFPLNSLFARSMEGATPTSALGYAGLSAHVGIVLLTSTLPLWFEFDWARIALGSVGLITAVHATLIAKIRADRKGAIANATSGTIGLIFAALACGYTQLALLAAFGHATFRMIQVLRVPNTIADSQNLRSALGGSTPWPKTVPNWLYQLSWALRRVDADFHFINVLHWMSKPLHLKKPWNLSKAKQWAITTVGIVLAGIPFTPVSHYLEEAFVMMLPTYPYTALTLMMVHFSFSVLLIRFLLLNVLTPRRFYKK